MNHTINGVDGYGHAFCRKCWGEPLTYPRTNRIRRTCCGCGRQTMRYQQVGSDMDARPGLAHCPAYAQQVTRLCGWLNRWDGLCLDSAEDRATLAHALVRDGWIEGER